MAGFEEHDREGKENRFCRERMSLSRVRCKNKRKQTYVSRLSDHILSQTQGRKITRSSPCTLFISFRRYPRIIAHIHYHYLVSTWFHYLTRICVTKFFRKVYFVAFIFFFVKDNVLSRSIVSLSFTYYSYLRHVCIKMINYLVEKLTTILKFFFFVSNVIFVILCFRK